MCENEMQPYYIPNKVGRQRIPCDGTAQAYMRHTKRGEKPCDASKGAWRATMRRYHNTGVWHSTLPFDPDIDDEAISRKVKRRRK